jgi:hypothetical protein
VAEANLRPEAPSKTPAKVCQTGNQRTSDHGRLTFWFTDSKGLIGFVLHFLMFVTTDLWRLRALARNRSCNYAGRTKGPFTQRRKEDRKHGFMFLNMERTSHMLNALVDSKQFIGFVVHFS